jgi:membrane-associated phospholipid phosphatase
MTVGWAESQKQKIAEVISVLFNPVLLAVISLALIANRYANNNAEFWHSSIVGILLLLGPASFYIVFIWVIEKRIDIDISQREDRIVPLVLATLGALIGHYIVSTRLTSQTLFILSQVLLLMLVSLTVVTFVWKISLHAAALMSLVTLLVIFRSPIFVFFYATIVPVAWARLTLKQHTPRQLIGGSIVGIGVTLLASAIFRN